MIDANPHAEDFAPGRPIVFRNGIVITVDAAGVILDGDVLITGDTITAVGQALPVPEDTAFVAYFGHLMGYDAGYYGYAWADAISADMATVFEKAPGGYFDENVGMRLRKEIYEPGDSRDVNISIEKFLGRQRSTEPFLKKIAART